MMDKLCKEFVDKLRLLSPMLEHAYAETIRYWEPDSPPVTTLFSVLGDQFAKEFKVAPPVQTRAGFAMIEDAMLDQSDLLGTAVATGLIEAIVGRAFNDGTWLEMRECFGPLSKAHADAWANE